MPALIQFSGGESHIVMRKCGLDRIVLGKRRLNQYVASEFPPSRSTGNLAQELKRTLGGAKVGQVYSHIRVYDTHQRYVGEIESLSDHLGAEKDVHFAALDSAEDLMMRPFSRGGVHIHARQSGLGEGLRDDPLDLLRPKASER